MAVIKSKSKPPTKRSLGVILESIGSDVKQVLEGHSVLDKKIEDLGHETRRELKFVNFSLKTLSDGQKDLSTKLVRLEEKYDGNFEQVINYLSKIDEEIQNLKKILTQKADVERLVQLEKRVAQIELVVKKWQK